MKYNTEKNVAYIKANVPKDRLEQYNAEIRADERRKFAEWLRDNFFANAEYASRALAEYEKEQKND